MGEGEKVRREDPKKSKTGNKLKQDQVQRWKKGDPLTEGDHKMLKQRFRLWKDVLEACGLPSLNDKSQVMLRTEAAEKKKKEEMNQ